MISGKRVGALGLALALSALAACQKAPAPETVRDTRSMQIRVGVLNPERVLQEMPQYQDLRSRLVRERGTFLAQLPENPKELSKEQWDRLRVETQQKQGNWQKSMLEMMQSAVNQISELTGQVCKEKGLDIVVIDSPSTSPIYYHAGQDVTLDVLLKLKQK